MNVVMVILDSLRSDFLGCYGNEWIDTPNIDAFAERSCLFERAYPESLPTIPVRRALHTGVRTFPFLDYRPPKGDYIRIYGWQPIPDSQVTVSETLREHGFRTAFLTDTYHQFKPGMNFHRGFDEWRWIRGQEYDAYNSRPAAGIERYAPRSGLTNERVLRRYLANNRGRRREADYLSPRVFSSASRWIRENEDAGRFYLVVDSFDPHEPWDPPGKYVERYDPDYEGREVITPLYRDWDEYLTREELEHMKYLYAAEVTMVDTWFGSFIDTLDAGGLMDDTLVAVVSDHGQQMGEHGPTGKVDRAMYSELLDIPLMIHLPGDHAAGKRVDDMVHNVDLIPTIFSYLGMETPGQMDGVDLKPAIDGRDHQARTHITSAYNDHCWIRDETHALLVRADGSGARLHDLTTDPDQKLDIADQEPETCSELYALLLRDAGGGFPQYVMKGSGKGY